jgi:aspartyl-tRNA synthetase
MNDFIVQNERLGAHFFVLDKGDSYKKLCAILGGSESIRDFIAFPKNNSGRDVMLDAPSTIDEKQFDELQIRLDLK